MPHHLLPLTALGVLAIVLGPATGPAWAQTTTVQGTVVDPNGRPLAGAEIRLHETGYTTQTDAAGRFVLPPGSTGNVSIRHSCCTDQLLPIDGPNLAVAMTVQDPAADPAGVLLRGRLARPDSGAAVSHANVTLTVKTSTAAIEYHTRSNAHGWYFLRIPNGSAQLRVAGPLHQTTYTNLAVDGDQRVDVPMPPAGATLHGKVTDAQGRTPDSAVVRLVREAKCAPPVCSASNEPFFENGLFSHERGSANFDFWQIPANGDGSWERAIGAGRIRITIGTNDTDYVEAVIVLDPGQTVRVDARLAPSLPTVRLEGRVTFADQNTSVPTRVLWETADGVRAGTVRPGPDGAFSILVPQGQILVRSLREADYACMPHHCPPANVTSPLVMITARPDQSRLPDLEIRRTALSDGLEGEVAGWVTNAGTGRPLAGAPLLFVDEATRDYGRAITDQHGSYRMRMPHGSYDVYVFQQGFMKQAVTLNHQATRTWHNASLDSASAFAVGIQLQAGGGATGTASPDLSLQPFVGTATLHSLRFTQLAGLGPVASAGQSKGSPSPGAPSALAAGVAALLAVLLSTRRDERQ